MLDKINWQKVNGMLPIVVQNSTTRNFLMLGYMNKQALELTLQSNEVVFFSRTKNRLWKKGETSGNKLKLIKLKLDCDQDAALALVEPIGNTCHTGTKSCFTQTLNLSTKPSNDILFRLEKIITMSLSRQDNGKSYTKELMNSSLDRIIQKVGEESIEVVIAAKNTDNEELKNEVSDLLYHLTMLMQAKNIDWQEVSNILQKRENR